MSVEETTFDAGKQIMLTGGYEEEHFVPLWTIWIQRGDAVLIFRNADLGHGDLGHVISCVLLDGEEMPKQGPDSPMTGFGWRYIPEYVIRSL